MFVFKCVSSTRDLPQLSPIPVSTDTEWPALTRDMKYEGLLSCWREPNIFLYAALYYINNIDRTKY